MDSDNHLAGSSTERLQFGSEVTPKLSAHKEETADETIRWD
jgi:hypothetical protein